MADRTVPAKHLGAAILVFVREPVPGRVKTRLAATLGAEAAARVYRRLAEHAIREAIAAGVPVRVHFTPGGAGGAVAAWLGDAPCYLPQAEGDLGRRMERAFDEAFAEGFERVLIVGSDLPDLSAELLRRALALLREHAAVLGPARDGGYWLLGLRGPAPFLFRDVPWSSPTVAAITLERLRRNGMEPALLPELTDVDVAADLPPGWLADAGADQR